MLPYRYCTFFMIRGIARFTCQFVSDIGVCKPFLLTIHPSIILILFRHASRRIPHYWRASRHTRSIRHALRRVPRPCGSSHGRPRFMISVIESVESSLNDEIPQNQIGSTRTPAVLWHASRRGLLVECGDPI